MIPLRDKMYRFARAIMEDDSLAEDKVHDVMERMWLNRRNLDHYSNLEAFVMVSVRNACYDALRRKRILRNHDMLQDSIVEETEIWDMRKMLHSAISLLDDRERTVVHLKDASQNAGVAARLMSPKSKEELAKELSGEYEALRDKSGMMKRETVSLKEAQENRLKLF